MAALAGDMLKLDGNLLRLGIARAGASGEALAEVHLAKATLAKSLVHDVDG